MYHVSAHGVDERMINVHYYYYIQPHVRPQYIQPQVWTSVHPTTRKTLSTPNHKYEPQYIFQQIGIRFSVQHAQYFMLGWDNYGIKWSWNGEDLGEFMKQLNEGSSSGRAVFSRTVTACRVNINNDTGFSLPSTSSTGAYTGKQTSKQPKWKGNK